MAERIIRASARPLIRFSSKDDFSLWLRRFYLYLQEAEIPEDKRAKELLSLLDESSLHTES